MLLLDVDSAVRELREYASKTISRVLPDELYNYVVSRHAGTSLRNYRNSGWIDAKRDIEQAAHAPDVPEFVARLKERDAKAAIDSAEAEATRKIKEAEHEALIYRLTHGKPKPTGPSGQEA